MNKRKLILTIPVCIGVLLIWGVISVSATQSHSPQLSELTVYVENFDGQPAASAYVQAYTDEGVYGGSGVTDAAGLVYLDIPPGTYDIRAYSIDNHFFLYQKDVPIPNSITMTAVGTPQVTLTAKKKDSAPLDQAIVSVGLSGDEDWLTGSVGYVEANGEIVFHITSGVFDIGVEDRPKFYYLVKLAQDLSLPSNIINFDMSQQPSSELVFEHPNDLMSNIDLLPSVGNVWMFSANNVPDGTRIVLTADQGFIPLQKIIRTDASGHRYEYHFELDFNETTYFTPGEVITFTVGGPLYPAGRTEDAYVGTQVQLASTVDSYGSFLGVVLYLETWWFYNPQITLTDPNGIVYNFNWWLYELPSDAPTGTYSVHLRYYTGPYQGWLTADSQFRVLPQQSSAVISTGGGTLYSSWDDTLYEFAPGTFVDDVIITHTVKYTDIPHYSPWVDIGHFYDVTAVYVETGLPALPILPYTITIGYDDWQGGVAIEDSLGLYTWNGLHWVPEPTSQVDPVLNHITATPNHFSTWGILGETNRIFVAIVRR